MENTLNIENDGFPDHYVQLRHWEGRMYTDDQLRLLPRIDIHHPHHKEWKFRDESSSKLCHYLSKKDRSLHILEVGCGNGWLSARLGNIIDSSVLGIDINKNELEQAIDVFQHLPNVSFMLAEPSDLLDTELRFDVIVFAASIQYFSSLANTVNTCMHLLHDDGEIHMADSHFYPVSQIAAARKRSEMYFEAVGFPELSRFYFHHSLDSIADQNFQVLYDPDGLFNRFLRNKNPFHWVRILK